MSVFNKTNPHCLNHIFDTSHEIVASEDIVDGSGVKLLARGTKISRSLKDKLDQRVLRSPLETSLGINNGITTSQIYDHALELMEQNPILQNFTGNRAAMGCLSRIRLFNLPGPIQLLLTIAKDRLPGTYKHALATTLISAGIVNSMHLSDRDAEAVLLCALLHDLGEMYLSPDYLSKARRLSLSEWNDVAAHPIIGRAIALEFGRLPEAASRGIVEHHERLDGSGYPQMLSGAQIGIAGAIVACADATAAMVLRGTPGDAYQATLALRIIPEEFDRASVSFITSALKHACDETPSHGIDIKMIQESLSKSRAAQAAIDTIMTGPMRSSADSLLAQKILDNIAKSTKSTGLALIGAMENPQEGAEWETLCVAKELVWRMRNLGRNLWLRLEAKEKNISPLWRPLLAALAGESPEEWCPAPPAERSASTA